MKNIQEDSRTLDKHFNILYFFLKKYKVQVVNSFK